MNWLGLVRKAVSPGTPAVLVMVAAVRGSAPRSPGAAMVVSAKNTLGTIGGGNLEFVAIDQARQMLRGSSPQTAQCLLQRFNLTNGSNEGRNAGIDLGQCCGGVAYLHFEVFKAPLSEQMRRTADLFDQGISCVEICHVEEHDICIERVTTPADQGLERRGSEQPGSLVHQTRAQRLLDGFNPDQDSKDLVFCDSGEALRAAQSKAYVLLRPTLVSDFRPYVFGAGHVGQALIPILLPLCDQVTWCDSRDQAFPGGLPANIRTFASDPYPLIASAPAGSYFLVMTHNHALDMALCAAILERDDFAYLGLIGSASKCRRFMRQLSEQGAPQARLDRMTCPIGIEGITNKEPAAIAIAVAAQLLQIRETNQPENRASDYGVR